MKVIYFNTIPSTNSFLRNMAESQDCEEFTTVLTDYQSAGRGQRETAWHSSSGQNLLCSVLLYPYFLPVQDQFELSKAVALAIYDTVCLYLPFENIQIKWPNDLYVNDKKIAGILIENAVAGKKISSSVVGVGLNINEKDFPSKFNPTSMQLQSGKKYSVEEVFQQYLENFRVRYDQLQFSAETVSHDYLANLRGFQQTLNFEEKASGIKFEAEIIGIAPDGMLEILTATGPRKYGFKEIAFL